MTGGSEEHNFAHAFAAHPGQRRHHDLLRFPHAWKSAWAGRRRGRSLVRAQIGDDRAQWVDDFRFWCWGEPARWVNDRRADASKVGTPLPGDLQKTQFTAEYFGYLIAKR